MSDSSFRSRLAKRDRCSVRHAIFKIGLGASEVPGKFLGFPGFLGFQIVDSAEELGRVSAEPPETPADRRR
jgi:hypothetical protein